MVQRVKYDEEEPARAPIWLPEIPEFEGMERATHLVTPVSDEKSTTELMFWHTPIIMYAEGGRGSFWKCKKCSEEFDRGRAIPQTCRVPDYSTSKANRIF